MIIHDSGYRLTPKGKKALNKPKPPKRWLIQMTKENLEKCAAGKKIQTRRINPRYEKIEPGDKLYFRCGYKTTYQTALGPFTATEKPKWEKCQDITTEDIIAEGLSTRLREQDAVDELDRQWRELWNSINKEPGKRFEDNPMVLRICWKKKRTVKQHI